MESILHGVAKSQARLSDFQFTLISDKSEGLSQPSSVYCCHQTCAPAVGEWHALGHRDGTPLLWTQVDLSVHLKALPSLSLATEETSLEGSYS